MNMLLLRQMLVWSLAISIKPWTAAKIDAENLLPGSNTGAAFHTVVEKVHLEIKDTVNDIHDIMDSLIVNVSISSKVDAVRPKVKKLLPTGEISEERSPDPAVQAVSEQMHLQISDKAQDANEVVDRHVLKKFATQVTNGINYFMKIQTADGPRSYVHARVHVAYVRHKRQNKASIEKIYHLDGLEFNKTADDPLTYVQSFRDMNPFTLPEDSVQSTTPTLTSIGLITSTRKRPEYGVEE